MSGTAVEKEPARETAEPPKTSYKILVVDDEQKFLTLIRKVFGAVGFQVETCEDPDQALELIEAKGPYAVVISDNRMKNMRGTEFLYKLRSASPNTVSILTTAYYDNSLIEEAINRAGPYRFLKKPVDYKLLIKAVQESLRKYEKNVEADQMARRIEALNKEKEAARKENQHLKEKIGKLRKTLRMFTVSLGVVLVLIFAGVGAVQLMETRAMESQSIRMGTWVVYPNRTALETESKKMWMTVDFRNLENRAPKSWYEAKNWVRKINRLKFAGYSDWRLPTIEEYRAIYDPQPGKVAYDRRKDIPVGYPKAFEDGGGYGFWASDEVGQDNAAYFFFVGGYSKVVDREYHSPALSVRLVRFVG